MGQALLGDGPRVRVGGRALSTWTLQREYGFVDADGAAPDLGAHARAESFGRDQAAAQQRFLEGFLSQGAAASPEPRAPGGREPG